MAGSISGISPIGGYYPTMSTSPVSSVGSVETVPMNYAVDNESEVSDVYTQMMRTSGAGSIKGPSPVAYPNAQIQENQISQVQEQSKANSYYNDIAKGFSGMNTSYDASGAGSSYQMVGSQFDFAV